MSRAGYTEDFDDQWDLIMWRGAVASAIRGKRGQTFLKDLLAALDALPTPRLIKNEFESQGDVCALGAVAQRRRIDLSKYDPEYPDCVEREFDIADALAREIMWQNDSGWRETPELRFVRVRKWVAEQIT